jgi:hypothetical protein
MSNMAYKQFTSNGTWTCPPGVTQVLAEGCGGGGAGGSAKAGVTIANYASWGGSGGACGIHSQHIIKVTPGITYDIAIGEGGVHGHSGLDGGDGGDTILSNTIVLGQITLTYTLFKALGGGGGFSVNAYAAYHITNLAQAVLCGGVASQNSVPVTSSDCFGLPNGYKFHVTHINTVAHMPPPIVHLYNGGFGGCGFANDLTYFRYTAASAGSHYPSSSLSTVSSTGLLPNIPGTAGTCGTLYFNGGSNYYGGGGGGGGAASAYGSGGNGGNGGNAGVSGANGNNGGTPVSTDYGAGGGGAGCGGSDLGGGGLGGIGGNGCSGILILSWIE